jgi:phosphopantothenoylcysteine decarboxylase/phosphopantothenate--cysteine ligase
MNQPQRIVLGISGGIAAYKMPQLIRMLRTHGVEVRVVLTEAATPLVGTDALKTLSANPVYCDAAPSAYDMDHIRLAEWGDLLLICPATANTIAKLACGLADNLLSTLALAFPEPIMVAPAMNTVMWNNPATIHNVSLLRQRGVRVLPVDSGALACGTSGPGRLIPLESVVEYALAGRMQNVLEGRNVLIAMGPTAEPIDPVRLLTNRSSGRMGAALAQAALCLGADVSVVTGPARVQPPCGCEVHRVMTAEEMSQALEQRFETADICIMAAAVSDFRPETVATEKLSRRDTAQANLKLTANPDIAARLGARKKHQLLVGFSLESGRNEARAREKMGEKNCDMMILNTVEEALEKESSAITLLFPDGTSVSPGTASKRIHALSILSHVAAKLR